MADPPPRYFDFGPFRADPMRRVLLRDGEPVSITAKVFDTLLLLVENHGRLLAKDELLKRLWPDRMVEEASLTQNIAVLRKILGESPGEHQYIVTVPGRGYRFVSPVRERPVAVTQPPADLSAAGIRPARRIGGIILGAVLGLAAGIVLALWMHSPAPSEAPVVRFAFTPGGATFWTRRLSRRPPHRLRRAREALDSGPRPRRAPSHRGNRGRAAAFLVSRQRLHRVFGWR